MNIYTNSLEEIASTGNMRMTITKMKYEFAQNPLRAMQRANAMIWGGASSNTCASLLAALSSVNAPRYHEGIRASIEAAVWHELVDISESAALSLARLNDARSIPCLQEALALRPDSMAIAYAINYLTKPL